jgi:exodeoxyribonuclease VII large subunit
MVAHTFVKTPTKGAQFLIEKVKEFIGSLDMARQKLDSAVKEFIEGSKGQLAFLSSKCESSSSRYFQLHKEELSSKKANINNFSKKFLSLRRSALCGKSDMLKAKLDAFFSGLHEGMKHKESKARLLDPKNILQRGYSITLKGSKPIKSIDDIKENDIIKTILYRGDIISFVKEKKKGNEQEGNKI